MSVRKRRVHLGRSREPRWRLPNGTDEAASDAPELTLMPGGERSTAWPTCKLPAASAAHT
jgi:hypothetical protein